jgi:hypothetical protein
MATETTADDTRWDEPVRIWRRPTPATIAVVTLVVAGLAARLAVMHSGIGAFDSDEAVAGLMARHVEAGQLRAFFWGQTYGGTLEILLASLLFELFGPSATALRAVPLALYAAAAVLVWRIGLRVTGRVQAAVAALLVWIWPANYLWWSVKARGFYEATLCLGLGIVLLALRITGDPGPRWRDWGLLGLVAGVGWWQSPQIALAAAPAAAWLLWALRARAWRAVASLPAFVLGSLPWWVPNLRDGFASLSAPRAAAQGGYLSHLSVFATLALPMTFGVREVYSRDWVAPVAITAACFAAGVVLVASGCVRRWPAGLLIVVLLLAYPFLNSLLTLAGTVAEGRYTLFMLPWLALCAAHGAGSRRWAAAALLAAAVAVTSLGLAGLHGRTSPYFSGRAIPASLAPLERALEAHGTTRLWSTYWLAYRVTFDTGERVVGAPITADRYPAYTRMVASADPPAAHVFLTGTGDDIAFRRGLEDRGIPYTAYPAGDVWTVYLPAVPVGPFDIVASTAP